VQGVVFWFKVCSGGFVFLHAFVLHFCLALSSRPLARNRWIALIYVPSLIFYPVSLSRIFVFSGFVRSGSLWFATPNLADPLFRAFMVSYLSYYIASIVMLLRWRATSILRRERMQATIVAASIIFTVALYNIEPFLVPAITGIDSIGMAANAGILWLSGLWFAITRYRLMSFGPTTMGAALFDATERPVAFLSPRLDITAANKAIETAAGSPEKGFIGHSLFEFTDMEEGTSSRALIDLAFPSRSTQATRIRFMLEPFRDDFGDDRGYIMFGEPRKPISTLSADRRLTPRESEILSYAADGFTNGQIAGILKISERTVKSHVTNLFDKLGVQNRVQMIRAYQDYLGPD
jgi:DNA-binding NarL/FixJ family response regulator